jgi:hypothetical protein
VLDGPGAPLEGEARSRQYARAGAFIVERCQVLIALWDGEPARGPGGTGALVRWTLEGVVPPEFSTLPDGDSGADPRSRGVVHIHPTTRRVTYLAAPGASARSTSAR